MKSTLKKLTYIQLILAGLGFAFAAVQVVESCDAAVVSSQPWPDSAWYEKGR